MLTVHPVENRKGSIRSVGIINIDDNELPSMEALDKICAEDKKMIKQTWNILKKNINDTAYCIFEMIFSQSPDTKQLFPFMKIHPENSSKRSKEMEFHSLRFMQVLESVVNALDNPESLNPLCDNLGRVHGRLTEHRGFKAHHWGVFIECTLFHFRRILSTDSHFHTLATLDRAIIIWRTILRILIKRMKTGLNTDLKNRQANREMEENNIASNSSSPINDMRPNGGLSHSTTLPLINVDGRVKAEPSGLFKPLRNFAKRNFSRKSDAFTDRK